MIGVWCFLFIFLDGSTLKHTLFMDMYLCAPDTICPAKHAEGTLGRHSSEFNKAAPPVVSPLS